MKFASLGSGSSGNATLVQIDDCLIMIDCGFGIRETEKRMLRLGVHSSEITAVLLTHEHSDHIKGAGGLSRKYGIPLYMTHGTYAARDYGKLPHLKLINEYRPFNILGVNITPVAVPHDAREPAQFTFEKNGIKLGILTDLGSLTGHVVESYQDCDGLLVEANHDPMMLAYGPYPRPLRERVAGAWGHLSNSQAAKLLQSIRTHKLQRIVVGHISQKNNSIALAEEALAALSLDCDICYACQEEGFDWLVISKPA